MEKLIYALWNDGGQSRAAFNATLLDQVAHDIAPHVHGLRINVQDDSVATGTSPRFVVTNPQMDAVVQLWVDSAYPVTRAPIDAALARVSGRVEGWLVAESTPLRNTQHRAGTPTDGFSQMVFLNAPDGMDRDSWRRHWQDGHTPVAIETQSNFEYVQNLVVRPLTAGAGSYDAIVEECFPMTALHSRAAFYDAVGDEAKLATNEARMMASCANFIGATGCDCMPTRQYDIKPFGPAVTPIPVPSGEPPSPTT